MIEYSLRTCAEFKDWEGEDDYISIYPMSGCWSYVGHVYPNQQNVSIQEKSQNKKSSTFIFKFLRLDFKAFLATRLRLVSYHRT